MSDAHIKSEPYEAVSKILESLGLCALVLVFVVPLHITILTDLYPSAQRYNAAVILVISSLLTSALGASVSYELWARRLTCHLAAGTVGGALSILLGSLLGMRLMTAIREFSWGFAGGIASCIRPDVDSRLSWLLIVSWPYQELIRLCWRPVARSLLGPWAEWFV